MELKQILDTLGIISTITGIISVVLLVVSALCGILPLLWRLGIGRWTTRIAIFSDNTGNQKSIKDDLVSSGLFRPSNIELLCASDIQKIDRFLIVVVCEDLLENLEKILARKKSSAGLIIYTTETKLSQEQMKLLNEHPLVALVNFRGRLISDLITILMGTAYVKKSN